MTTRSALTAFAFVTGIGLAYVGLLDHAYVAPSAPVVVGTTETHARLEDSAAVRVAPATHGVRVQAAPRPACSTDYRLGGTITTCR